MKKLNLIKIKEMLEAQKTDLINKITNNSADIDFEGDETDEIQAKILELANAKLLARDREKIVKIDNALKKINENNFGVCEDCGEEIGEKRLLFNPYFSNCISCAEELEILKKRNLF